MKFLSAVFLSGVVILSESIGFAGFDKMQNISRTGENSFSVTCTDNSVEIVDLTKLVKNSLCGSRTAPIYPISTTTKNYPYYSVDDYDLEAYARMQLKKDAELDCLKAFNVSSAEILNETCWAVRNYDSYAVGKCKGNYRCLLN